MWKSTRESLFERTLRLDTPWRITKIEFREGKGIIKADNNKLACGSSIAPGSSTAPGRVSWENEASLCQDRPVRRRV
ncbi:MAG: hypothetical protein NTV33_01755 [Coprothermobacterota bacterium]|nr:hypothetical protein [Coprothermobacterota bacterium]